MLKRIVKKIRVRSTSEEKLPLVNAFNEQCFFVHNGPVLSNLRDLLRAFSHMTEAQFNHHVTSERNDFVLWIKKILQDGECAEAVGKADTIKKAASAVSRRLKEYRD